jgi:hypothetical protein
MSHKFLRVARKVKDRFAIFSLIGQKESFNVRVIADAQETVPGRELVRVEVKRLYLQHSTQGLLDSNAGAAVSSFVSPNRGFIPSNFFSEFRRRQPTGLTCYP